jgi:hypothetical protein
VLFAQALTFDPRVAPELPLRYCCEATGAWQTQDTRCIEALAAHHVFMPAFGEARLKWRASQPLTILELRTWRLAAPAAVLLREEHFGCFSWVDFAPELASCPGLLEGAVPALSDDEFANRQGLLREQLRQLDVQPLALT